MDVADQSFSVEIWFKYTEQANAGSLVWGYNVAAGNPQFWIRTEPGDNRIRGLIHDKTSTSIIIQTKAPHNDENWHHLAFVRDSNGEDTLTVYIDGKVEDSQNGKIGSVTEGQEYGIHLGQRVDGVNVYKGILDEFRLWTRALSEPEIKGNMTKGKSQIMAVRPVGLLTTTWGEIRSQ
jgi:sialidase-1